MAVGSNGKIYAIGGTNPYILATVEESMPPFESDPFSIAHNGSLPLTIRRYMTSLYPKASIPSRSAAFGSDGIEIAPNTNYTFTVDYAGGVADTTPPARPAVIACGSSNITTLSAHWSAVDPRWHDYTIPLRHRYDRGRRNDVVKLDDYNNIPL